VVVIVRKFEGNNRTSSCGRRITSGKNISDLNRGGEAGDRGWLICRNREGRVSLEREVETTHRRGVAGRAYVLGFRKVLGTEKDERGRNA